MKIPILNIYYLLCYAWDKLEEGKKVNVSNSDYNSLIELFARVLINGCKHLLKRGLDQSYEAKSEEYVGIKGKIYFSGSLKSNLFDHGRAICDFDELEINILINQIIKSSLSTIYRVESLDKELKQEIFFYRSKFYQVEEIKLSSSLFSKVRLNRNNSFYDFVLKVCQLIYENTVVDESTGKSHFKEFVGNDKQMASLFELFIRNFYIKEQNEFNVDRENIYWRATALDQSDIGMLPIMQTDITFESPNRKIIMETKYYSTTLNLRYEQPKFHSNNLYQLYSYLKNNELNPKHTNNDNAEGILLYPSVNYNLSQCYLMDKHKLSVITIDLGQEWKLIHKNLLDIIQCN